MKKKRAKRVAPTSGGHRKKLKAVDERTTVKDVVLIPGPKANIVPKGAARKELFVRGFVTTFELRPSMTEKQIRDVLEEKLNKKLESIAFPKFEFVRAVSNKLIRPELSAGESFDGRMVRHFPAQGPVYIRATKDIAKNLLKSYTNAMGDEDSDDSAEELPAIFSEDDSDNDKPLTIYQVPDVVHAPNIPSTSSGIDESTTSITTSIPFPTCNNCFPLAHIQEHADRCA